MKKKEAFRGKKNWSYPDPRTDNPREHYWQRFFEVIPGFLTWTTLFGMFLVSWIFPVYAAIFIIIFDIYWVYRTIYISSYSIISYRKMKRWEKIDWFYRLREIFKGDLLVSELQEQIQHLQNKIKKKNYWSKEWRFLRQELIEKRNFLIRAKYDLENKDYFLDWSKIYQVVLLPTAIETAESIEPAIQAIKDSNYPNNKIIILLAMEERELEDKRRLKERVLRNKFDGVFFDFLITVHKVVPGEMKCKASNTTYATKELKEYLEKKKIPIENVILSNFDCETIAHPQYLAALAYSFATEPKRHNHAYQPIPMYHNNIWDVIAPVRILMMGCSFWHMVKVMQPDKMVTFSSHSESLKTIIDIGYWPVNVISEDSLVYWNAYCYFDGNYKVKPIYLPVSMDAVLGDNYWHSLKNQYKQKHRWAYGIENFPLMCRAFMKSQGPNFLIKIKRALSYMEGHFSWATVPFMLALLGWLPLFFGGEEFNETVLAHNLPYITRFLMTLAMLGLVTSMSMSFFLIPPRPKHYSKWRSVPMVVQWIFAPVIALISSVPAVHAQTRIMIGKYMGSFWVTEKIIKKRHK